MRDTRTGAKSEGGQGVGRCGGQDSIRIRRDIESKGGRDNKRDRRSAAVTRVGEHIRGKGGRGEEIAQNRDGRDGGGRRGD